MKRLNVLAKTILARKHCLETGNREWLGNWDNCIQDIMETAPSGSGFDSGTELAIDESGRDRLTFYTAFHHMDEYGGYDGWTDHRVVVKADLVSDCAVRVSGRDRNEIKDYIAETFHYWLSEDIDE
jgi:hypothetical protein